MINRLFLIFTKSIQDKIFKFKEWIEFVQTNKKVAYNILLKINYHGNFLKILIFLDFDQYIAVICVRLLAFVYIQVFWCKHFWSLVTQSQCQVVIQHKNKKLNFENSSN